MGKVGGLSEFYAKICAEVVVTRGFAWIICVLCGCCALIWPVWGTGVAYADTAGVQGITARYALLMDADTGQVLWQHDGYDEVPPASTTKILTALLALDIATPQREVTVSSAAAAVGESSVGLLAGERFALGELLDAALLKSANDACFAIAEGVAGDEPLFVRLMNLKADVLGAGGAQLTNTNGLPAVGHTMSAYDLAALARVAMQNAEFAERVGAQTAVMQGGNYNRSLKNTNRLLAMNPYVTGVKTGTTNAAGACLVSAMERDGRRVIAVVLHSADRYGDSLRLLNFGIDGFVNQKILAKGALLGGFVAQDVAQPVRVCAATDLCFTLPCDYADRLLTAQFAWRKSARGVAVAAGDLLGTLTFSYDGERLGAVNLLAVDEYRPGIWERLWQNRQ